MGQIPVPPLQAFAIGRAQGERRVGLHQALAMVSTFSVYAARFAKRASAPAARGWQWPS